jgi:nitrite reductase/ring-hydroxylating ferredoxin subunit
MRPINKYEVISIDDQHQHSSEENSPAMPDRRTIVGADFLRVGTLEEVQAKGCVVVKGTDRPIAVFHHEGRVHAVDNRCPHMGFPLHKGTVKDGILTCHWHHARFDLASGCTFDLFADDVPAHAVEIRDGAVWVSARPRRGDEAKYRQQRLHNGMEQGIRLVIAKAVIGMMRGEVGYQDIVRQALLFGVRYRDGWSSGMTILMTMANLVPYVPEEETYLALYQGVTRVADDSRGQTPRRENHPLDTDELDFATLKRWFRYWTQVRHRDGAERTLLTAIAQSSSPREIAELLFTAVTDRYYADTGHALDFINKAFESLDLIGWEHASEVLPTVVRQLAAARGGEEMNSWRHPLDLVPPLEETFAQLPALFAEGREKVPATDVTSLAHDLLGDDPLAIIETLKTAIRSGARATDLSKALCYAAALRIARFGTANEFGDWITTLHTFTYCNALHQSLKRLQESDDTPGDVMAVRGIFHGAISVYLDRFLNVPPAALPREEYSTDGAHDADELRAKFLEALDAQQRVDEAARITARYLAQGDPVEPLIATFTRAVVREDAEFHTFQMLEAGVRQYEEWRGTEQGKNILIAVARYLAAHSPTQRAQLQTAQIALRLHRGEMLYEEEAETAAA